ncbi:hypothetical protein VKT23_010017 [Stygiomarasmius scandens]|uniref:Uncharacterized protein n=1 Tax=Marasmiellus scandens TaxID=2682957 RepID=A0ABR1JCU3_9AGAR
MRNPYPYDLSLLEQRQQSQATSSSSNIAYNPYLEKPENDVRPADLNDTSAINSKRHLKDIASFFVRKKFVILAILVVFSLGLGIGVGIGIAAKKPKQDIIATDASNGDNSAGLETSQTSSSNMVKKPSSSPSSSSSSSSSPSPSSQPSPSPTITNPATSEGPVVTLTPVPITESTTG